MIMMESILKSAHGNSPAQDFLQLTTDCWKGRNGLSFPLEHGDNVKDNIWVSIGLLIILFLQSSFSFRQTSSIVGGVTLPINAQGMYLVF